MRLVAIFLPKEEKNIRSLANFGNPRFALRLGSMGIFVTGLNGDQNSFAVRPRAESFFFATFVSVGSIGLISDGPAGFVSRAGHGSGSFASPREINSFATFSGKL